MHFFTIIIAGIIGGIISPYFSHFLTITKTNKEKRSNHLEQVYLLARKLEPFAYQSMYLITSMIAVQKDQLSWDEVKKQKPQISDPFADLYYLMDYHLTAPTDLCAETTLLQILVMLPVRTWAEALSANNKDEMYSKALNQAVDTIEKAKPLTIKLINWVKQENLKIESDTLLNKIKQQRVIAWFLNQFTKPHQ